jgi:hypothetical protein
MPGESTLTADAAEQAVLRNLSKSEHRGEALNYNRKPSPKRSKSSLYPAYAG